MGADTEPELVSNVRDMRRVPLSELVRAREARAARPADPDAVAGEFNSSV